MHQGGEASSRSRSDGPRWWPIPAVFATQLLVFVPLARWRFLDTDEGYQTLAAARVLDGLVPYRDFFYPQAPLTAYVYAGWTGLFGESWVTARMLSALLAAALGTLLFAHVRRRFGGFPAAIAVTLYASSSLVLGWLTTVKTHALSTLLVFAAYTLVAGAPRLGRARWLAVGALLGLAIDVRLLYAAAVPAFVWAAIAAEPRRRVRATAQLAGGIGLGLLPLLPFALADTHRFVFDNLGYHGIRSSGGLIGNFRQKAELAFNLFGVGTSDGAIGARAYGGQMLILVLAAVVAAVALRRPAEGAPLALALAVLLGLASFLPTPSYTQYFVVTVPFLCVVAAALVARLAASRAATADATLALAGRAALAAVLAAYLGLGVADGYRYVNVRGAEDARIDAVRRVAREIDAHTEPGDRVLVSWQGYLTETHADPVRGAGLANFALIAVDELEPDEADDNDLLTNPEVERLIRTRSVPLLVLRPWVVAPHEPDWAAVIRSSGYRELPSVGSARLFER